MRERLIDLLIAAKSRCDDTEKCKNCVGFCHVGECLNYLIADHLLANGVIVPPCKVGDTVYALQKERSGHFEGNKYVVDDEGEWEVCEKEFNLSLLDAVGEWIFLTREEAEQALKGGAD